MTNNKGLVFISHSSEDKEYAKILVNLLVASGINNIVCSSLNSYHIPNDENIYDYLEQKLKNNAYVIFLLSENYYNSAASLNEMGACWVLKNQYTTILTPNFEFEEIKGAVNPNKIALKLNDEERLLELINSLKEKFGTDTVVNMEFFRMVETSIEEVNQLAYDEKMDISQPVRVKFESIFPIGETLKIGIRVINNSSDRYILDYLKINLVDSKGYEISQSVSLGKEMLRGEENKVLFLDLEKTEYEYFMHKMEQLDLRYYKDI